MNVEGETCSESLEQKSASLSPSMQSDLSTDGDASTNQNNSLSNDKFSSTNSNVTGNEPKTKKRRKQSNPLKIQNTPSPKFDLPTYELVEQGETDSDPAIPSAFDEGLSNQNHVSEKTKVVDYTSQIISTRERDQKGSLSRVTNALFNSKMKETANVSKVNNKSKESSLSSGQSITDISSPESSEEVVTSNSGQNAYPQMPPLLPINPVDVANDTVKVSNYYPFPEFSSPMQQTNFSLSHRSFITSNGIRVFNPEAYCELCEKEFCNKYFLKTHKANKHGICSVDNSTGGYSYRVSYKNMHMNPQVTQQMISQMCENGATFGSADSYCNICQKYFCNKYFLKKHRQNIHGIPENQETTPSVPSSIHVPVISSPLPVIRVIQDSKSVESSSVHGTKDEESKFNVSLENIKNSLNNNASLLNGSSLHNTSHIKSASSSIDQKEKKSEKFLCELCNIEFCDKCYLDAHRQNKHGPAKVSGTEFPEFAEVGKIENNEKSNSVDDVEEPKDNFKGQMCAPCMKNFTSAESFQNHMLEAHGASIKEEDEASRMSDIANRKNCQNFEKDTLSQVEKSPAMQEIENSNSSNDSGTFSCNMCFIKCKDRNSYATHMESEHSVMGTSGSDSSGLTQDANMQCDTCQEQFPDRLTLMSHKFKIHGIISPGLEAYADGIENGDFAYFASNRQKPGGSSFCQICNKELCNKYFMKTHMLKMHGIDVDNTQQERWPSASGGVYCDICQKFLCSKYFLKVHKQNVHGIMDESSKLSMVGSPSYSSNVGLNEKKYERHSGNYSQVMKFSNVNAGDSSALSKEDILKRNSVFSCDICGQEFLTKLQLQIHLVNKHVKCNESKAFPSVVVNAYSQLSEDSREALKSGVLPCSCCSYVSIDDISKAPQVSSEFKISCIVCNVTYYQSEYHNHHLSHGTSLPTGRKLENGMHELNAGFNHSGNSAVDPNMRNKIRPRKFKRFRCSKCDKTFRTKIKCLHHIQVTHKSKKSLSSQCDLQNPSKKTLTNTGCKRNLEEKSLGSGGTENGSNLVYRKEVEGGAPLLTSSFCESKPLPVPYILPNNSDVIMQPFHLSEPKPEGITKQDIFVPSLVYLPVSQKVSEPLTVAFTLTPA